MGNKKKNENKENVKKTNNSLKGIFPSEKLSGSDISENQWIDSINNLKEKSFSKLSLAVDAVVDEVINKLNLKPTCDLKVFLHDLCTDSPRIMECIEKELIQN